MVSLFTDCIEVIIYLDVLLTFYFLNCSFIMYFLSPMIVGDRKGLRCFGATPYSHSDPKLCPPRGS